MRPGEIEPAGSGTRHRVEISGENYYLTIGSDFVHATVPAENKPGMAQVRLVVETICELVTRVQGGAGGGVDNV